MSDNNGIREKTIFGMFWKFAERISAQLTSFAISIILARLLLPEDYGAVALVTVFISLCNVLVSNGLGTSLVQKKDPDELDYSSMFIFAVALSIAVYFALFAVSPFVADYFDMPVLKPVMRVMSLRVILAAVNTVQHAYVSKTMQFKKFFWATLIGTVISGVVGVVLAYKGFGIWALVFQYLTNTTIDTIVLFITVKWRPHWMFSASRLRGLLSFGWKIMIAAFVNEVYNSLRTLIIGKVYTPADLSYYDKADNYPTLISRNIDSTLSSVLFPAISTSQNDIARVKSMLRRSIKTSSYFVLPMLLGFALVSEEFIRVVLTEKWMPCVVYMQILCISHCLTPLSSANHQAIKAIGRSDVTMKQEIIIKSVGLVIIIATVPISVMAITIGATVIEVWNFVVTILPNKKLIDYSISEQLKDVLPNAIISMLMASAVFAVGLLDIQPAWLLVIKVFAGVVSYALLSYLTKNETFYYLVEMIRNK